MDEVCIITQNMANYESLRCTLSTQYSVRAFDTFQEFFAYADVRKHIFCVLVMIDDEEIKTITAIIKNFTKVPIKLKIVALNDQSIVLPVAEIYNSDIDYILINPINTHRFIDLLHRGQQNKRQGVGKVNLTREEISALTRGMQEIKSVSPKYFG